MIGVTSSVMPLGEAVDSIRNQGMLALAPPENGPETVPTETGAAPSCEPFPPKPKALMTTLCRVPLGAPEPPPPLAGTWAERFPLLSVCHLTLMSVPGAAGVVSLKMIGVGGIYCIGVPFTKIAYEPTVPTSCGPPVPLDPPVLPEVPPVIEVIVPR